MTATRTRTERFLLAYYPGTLQDLPLISPVACRAADEAARRTLTDQEVIVAIRSDPFLSAKLVGVANSIYFNQTHTDCYTVQDAFTRVGRDYSEALLRNAERLLEPTLQPAVMDLWRHSIRVATLAARFGERARDIDFPVEGVYWLSMIHDIGILILSKFERDVFAAECSGYLACEKAPDEHSTLGHSLAHYWSLPNFAQDVIRWHHSPANGATPGARAVAALTRLAELVADGDDLANNSESKELAALAGLAHGDVEDIMGWYRSGLTPDVREFGATLDDVWEMNV